MTALLLATSTSGCGFAAAGILRTTEITKSAHPLLENDARVLCGGVPCDAVPIVSRESAGWRAPLFFGSLVDLSVGGVLLGKQGTPARIGGYVLLAVGAIELLAQLTETFPHRDLDGRATVVWRDKRLDLTASDLAGQNLREGLPLSVAKIVQRREHDAPAQPARE